MSKRKFWLLAFALLIVLSGCATHEKDEKAEFYRNIRNAAKYKYTPAQTAKWRAERLPVLLLAFAKKDPKLWSASRKELLSDPRTPKYLVKKLKQNDVFAEASRKYFANEGTIYSLLASFNSNYRDDWRAARKSLMQRGENARERCIFNLILRLNVVPENEEYSDILRKPKISKTESPAEAKRKQKMYEAKKAEIARKIKQYGKSKLSLYYRKAFWASDELVEIGAPAVKYLIIASYWLWTPQFTELVYLTLAKIGEPAVPVLIKELEKADEMPTAEAIFFRKRKLVSTLGDVYAPERFVNPDWLEQMWQARLTGKIYLKKMPSWYKEQRPDWQKNSKLRKKALKEITIQLRDYDPINDSQRYIFRLTCVEAIRKIGLESGVVPLVELWEENVDDEFLTREIIPALVELYPADVGKVDSLESWKRIAAKLTDPEDFE